jgi:hypothetical protein
MATKDSIDDSSSLSIENLYSLLQDSVVSGSSNSHVVDVDALISGLSSPHASALISSIPLFSDDDDNFPFAVVTLPSGR